MIKREREERKGREREEEKGEREREGGRRKREIAVWKDTIIIIHLTLKRKGIF